MTEILIKTYMPDILATKRLLRDLDDTGTKLGISVVSDKETLKKLAQITDLNLNTVLINEDEFLTSEDKKLTGYVKQQIVKLRYHLASKTNNYFTLDSDCRILRKITESDFVDSNGEFKDQLDINCDAELYNYWNSKYKLNRDNYRRYIMSYFGLEEIVNIHGMTALDCGTLQDLMKFIDRKGDNLGTLLQRAPMEYSWYYGFKQSDKRRLNVAGKLIYTFHTLQQYKAMKNNISLASMKENYAGYVLNSNWSDKYGVQSYGENIRYFHIIKEKLIKMSKSGRK